jgi:lysozyme|tara:strand:- start:91 stop:537 length:447 start_codon:yes stop_codon:yes gene_type:complete
MNIGNLREQLKIDEGVKYEVYNDHLGYKTFGIGHLVVAGDLEYGAPVGTQVSEERVNAVFDKDVQTYINESKKVFPNLESLLEEAQQVIVNMCFNMGAPRLSKFKRFIAAVNESNWSAAAVEMMDSRWATQVGLRAERLRDRINILSK